ncbi:MAG: hypothetical protein H7Y11_06975 [Armatimonadetes bacterium]|nr:hypothetical protein [Anaerolineae bacterium]
MQPHDPALVTRIYDLPNTPNRIQKLEAAVQKQWLASGWYQRAILRDVENNAVAVNRLDLEAQVWALISGVAQRQATEAALLATVETQLDTPSPIGGALTVGGAVWPAISQLLTWGYLRSGRADLAWRSFNRHTFAVHSTFYPDMWLNTWSGPDGINGTAAGTAAGGTWASPLTPMQDFPVMNANQDSMALLALIRLAGIEPARAGDGLRIAPSIPRDRWTLVTRLLTLEVEPGRIAGRYNAIANGSRSLYMRVPVGASAVQAWVDGQPVADAVLDAEGDIVLRITFTAEQSVGFEVRFTV